MLNKTVVVQSLQFSDVVLLILKYVSVLERIKVLYFVYRAAEIGVIDNTICSPVTPLTTQVKEQTAKLNARQQTILELFQTEKNYVGILHTILKVFVKYILSSVFNMSFIIICSR